MEEKTKTLVYSSDFLNFAAPAKTKWILITTMLSRNASVKNVSNMQLGIECIIYLIIFFKPSATFEEATSIS